MALLHVHFGGLAVQSPQPEAFCDAVGDRERVGYTRFGFRTSGGKIHRDEYSQLGTGNRVRRPKCPSEEPGIDHAEPSVLRRQFPRAAQELSKQAPLGLGDPGIRVIERGNRGWNCNAVSIPQPSFRRFSCRPENSCREFTKAVTNRNGRR